MRGAISVLSLVSVSVMHCLGVPGSSYGISLDPSLEFHEGEWSSAVSRDRAAVGSCVALAWPPGVGSLPHKKQSCLCETINQKNALFQPVLRFTC